jgi:hypothetical protein
MNLVNKYLRLFDLIIVVAEEIFGKKSQTCKMILCAIDTVLRQAFINEADENAKKYVLMDMLEFLCKIESV